MQAAANAKNNLGMKKANLYVSECFADGGPVLKRVRPRAKGRYGLQSVISHHLLRLPTEQFMADRICYAATQRKRDPEADGPHDGRTSGKEMIAGDCGG